MKEPIIKLDVELSTDRQYVFSRCEFVFGSVNVGDYEQLMLAKSLLLALEDLVVRMNNFEPIECAMDDLENVLSNTIREDIRNSCLPLGVEAFDGDEAVFVDVHKKSFIIIKPWASTTCFTEELSISQYCSMIETSIDELKEKLKMFASISTV